MSKIINATAVGEKTVSIEFENGSKIIFNMQNRLKTLPYQRLKNPRNFQAVRFDEKSIYWDPPDKKPEYLPLRISVDTILFSLRD